MKKALIIGGTGLVGKQLTYLLVGDKRYAKIILLVRTPMNIIHNKLEQVVFDFDNPDFSAVKGDDIFCCLGTTIRDAGSKAAFYKVDYEYVIMLATHGFKNGASQLALVSAMGANKSAAVFYNQTKGKIEEAVKAIGYRGCFIFRPSLLLGHRSEFRMGESIAKIAMTAFSFMLPKKYKAVDADKVAKAMQVVMNSGKIGVKIFESDFINGINY